MYSEISRKFRSDINDYDNFLIAYSKYKNMPIWDCLCAGMDWIQLACDNLDSITLYDKNENLMSMNTYNYISCIDIILEAITQINEVLGIQVRKPLKKRFDIFNDNKYNMNDRDYFKMIRAAFGAHSVKLSFEGNFTFSKGYFASWPSFIPNEEYDAYVYLYGQQCKSYYETIGFRFESLKVFLNALIEMFGPIIDQVVMLHDEFVNIMKNSKIVLCNNEIKNIEMLEEESIRRGLENCFSGHFSKLRLFYKICSFTCIDDILAYKPILDDIKNSITNQLQNMKVKEIQNDMAIYPNCNDQGVWYNYQNLNENVFSGLPKPYSKENLATYLKDAINIPDNCTEEELCCLVTIGLYKKSLKMNDIDSKEN